MQIGTSKTKNSKSKTGDQSYGSNRFKNPTSKVNKAKNLQRLGGGGLSLEAFANAKTKRNTNSNHYNPSEIKKKKEFYKNAKYLKKFKRQVKPESQEADENESGDTEKITKEDRKSKKGSYNLEAVYAKKHGEVEKERLEREATMKVRKEEREKAEARRKELREKMFKKTKKGQPVMKYRIEHLLESIQRSAT